MDHDQPDQQDPRRRSVVISRVVKWSLCGLILWFVGQRARSLLAGSSWTDVEIAPEWVALSAMIYCIGWIPSVWFWHSLLRSLGQNVHWTDTARAYYCGHLGKYIPGKATVLFIRGGLLKDRGSSFGIAALTATYETLVMMGTGLACGLAMLPSLFTPGQQSILPAWLSELAGHRTLFPLAIVGIALLALPLSSFLLNRIAQKMTPVREQETATEIRTRFLALGMLLFVISWSLHAISLMCILRGLGGEDLGWRTFPQCFAAVTLATSIGFIALFAPGGVGIREGILIETTRTLPGVEAAIAVTAAIALRLVWLITELLVGGILFLSRRQRPQSD